MTHRIKVDNVQCISCVNTIKTELEKLEGIKSVSYSKNEVRITTEANVERKTATKALAKIGYPEK